MTRLILLTEYGFADVVAAPLRAAAPDLDVRIAATLADLESGLDGAAPVRIVSFGSGVIVPPALLARVGAGAYNFHPGPPAYPGIFPSVFALYDGAGDFGVTLHEMTAEIDAGPIVAVAEFPIAQGWDRLGLDTASFTALMTLLERSAKRLTDLQTPLTHTTHTWSAPRRTRKDFNALCHLPDDVTPEEFARRYRAVGEGPDHALTFTRFGRSFRLQSRGGDVVRGGQPVKT
ncbi:MAG: hypothetical protein K2P94_19095 [Rhodospirillaceae bacterium]|nr:hypothetical protein [Rhodospirillaceae bacterium]